MSISNGTTFKKFIPLSVLVVGLSVSIGSVLAMLFFRFEFRLLNYLFLIFFLFIPVFLFVNGLFFKNMTAKIIQAVIFGLWAVPNLLIILVVVFAVWMICDDFFIRKVCVNLITCDASFEQIHRIPLENSRVSVYRTNGGATTSYGIILRQEKVILPGVLLIKDIADYSTDDVSYQVIGPNKIKFFVEDYPEKVYEFKKYVYF